MLDAGHELRVAVLRLAGELDVIECLAQLADHGAQLAARKLSAEAEVGADAEGSLSTSERVRHPLLPRRSLRRQELLAP